MIVKVGFHCFTELLGGKFKGGAVEKAAEAGALVMTMLEPDRFLTCLSLLTSCNGADSQIEVAALRPTLITGKRLPRSIRNSRDRVAGQVFREHWDGLALGAAEIAADPNGCPSDHRLVNIGLPSAPINGNNMGHQGQIVVLRCQHVVRLKRKFTPIEPLNFAPDNDIALILRFQTVGAVPLELFAKGFVDVFANSGFDGAICKGVELHRTRACGLAIEGAEPVTGAASQENRRNCKEEPAHAIFGVASGHRCADEPRQPGENQRL